MIRSGAITLSLSRFCVYHTKRWPRHRLPQKDGFRQQGCGTVVFTAHNNTAGGSTERERGRNARRAGEELGVEKGVLLASKSCGTGALRAVELSIGAVRPRARSTAAVVWCSGTQYTRREKQAHALVFLFRVVGTTRSLSRVR